MLRLIYSSVANADLTKDDIKSILDKSQVKNKRLNITGVLIYGPGMFLQILEGDEENVKSLLEQIIADDRHSEIEVLCEFPVEERSFKDWSMGLIFLKNKNYEIAEFDQFNTIINKSKVSQDSEGKFVQACLNILNCW